MTRTLSVVSVLVTSSLALWPRWARADQPVAGHWEAGVGLGVGAIWIDDPGLPEANRGRQAGLVANAGYIGSSGVGVMVDASLWYEDPDECVQDGPCFNSRAQRVGMVAAALRWQVWPRLYVQGGGGGAVTRSPSSAVQPETWWSPVGIAAIGTRFPISDAHVGLELRATTLRNDTTWVSSGAVVLSLGHAW